MFKKHTSQQFSDLWQPAFVTLLRCVVQPCLGVVGLGIGSTSTKGESSVLCDLDDSEGIDVDSPHTG